MPTKKSIRPTKKIREKLIKFNDELKYMREDQNLELKIKLQQYRDNPRKIFYDL